ncbi:MAG: hypothetical protein HPY55_01200 [Firmicutes bacterium]|nr:hypothetical protein [Bacillota bacterium]
MSGTTRRQKLSIYIDDAELRRRAKVAAARRDMSLSQFCEEAVREKIDLEEGVDRIAGAIRAAQRMDERRARIGRLGLSARDLIDEGRRIWLQRKRGRIPSGLRTGGSSNLFWWNDMT